MRHSANSPYCDPSPAAFTVNTDSPQNHTTLTVQQLHLQKLAEYITIFFFMATWPLLEPSMSAPYSGWSCCQLQATTEISNEKLDKTMNFKWLMMVVACLWKTSFGLNLNSCSVLKLLLCKSVFSMGGNFWEFWRRGCNIWDGKNRRLYNFRVFARPAQATHVYG